MPKRLGRTAPHQAHQGAVAGPGDHESRITPRMVFLFDAAWHPASPFRQTAGKRFVKPPAKTKRISRRGAELAETDKGTRVDLRLLPFVALQTFGVLSACEDFIERSGFSPSPVLAFSACSAPLREIFPSPLAALPPRPRPSGSGRRSGASRVEDHSQHVLLVRRRMAPGEPVSSNRRQKRRESLAEAQSSQRQTRGQGSTFDFYLSLLCKRLESCQLAKTSSSEVVFHLLPSWLSLRALRLCERFSPPPSQLCRPGRAHQGAVAGPGDHESRITPRMVFLFDASRTLVWIRLRTCRALRSPSRVANE